MLRGLSNLKKLYIYENRRLSEIPSGILKKLQNLTTFFASSCSFSSLEEDVFSDLINSKTVTLKSNKIERLPPNLLRNNILLTVFSCSNNKISTLPTRIFHELSELRWLFLKFNRLENLPEDVFQNLSSLQSLDLSENRLTFLHENIFFPLTNLTFLDLSKNNLTKIIGKLPFGRGKHLNYLRLKNVGLTEWLVINWSEYNLTYVDFSNNHFDTVKLPIYTPNRMQMNLSNCKIRTIYLDDWKYGFRMPIYYLSNNEITCDYEQQQFISVFKSNTQLAKKMFLNIENTKFYGEERNLLDNTSFVIIGNYCPINFDCSAQQDHVMVNCSGKGTIDHHDQSTKFQKFSSRMRRVSI
ncbi:platelet glycoprotein V-like [Centruroides sculpturatus]|uniref:platelet glycoprotein V-like n=1 Tax=Centruroides sculpturatus TaxID=218467 RepID=UPI000C6D239A|nr:platelet glycoprotein V-like [Centruroides sculpturatus]